MNIVKLLNLIKDQIDYGTFEQIRNDFMNDFSNEYRKLKPCKSVMEKSIKAYIANCSHMDDNLPGLYTDGRTAIITNKAYNEYEPKNIKHGDLKMIVDLLKDRKPTDCYFFDSIALYKALNKQEKLDYMLEIDGHLYNAKYISEMVDCIATNKDNYIRADICTNGALFMQATNTAIVLPIKGNICPAEKNINSQAFLKFLQAIENEKIEDIRMGA